MPTIILSDDHPMVLHGLRAVLQAERNFAIVGAAVNGEQTIELVSRLKPDILVLDILLPDINGIELLQKLDTAKRDTRVIIFSMHANDGYVRSALQAGAAGFVLKDAPASELIHAIHEAMAGRRFLSPAITDRAVDMYLQQTDVQSTNPIEVLTSRERQILQLVALGETNTTIADRLAISPRTVETHRANIMRKLGLKSQGDLLRYAIMQGMQVRQETHDS